MFDARHTTTLMATLILVLAAGCHNPLPCPDCGEEVAEESPDEDEPLPDLPCDGADLMTDNDNCGSCGNECQLNFEGTDWEAGSCKEGSCGPLWTTCLNYAGSHANCGEVCASFDQVCVAQGCSGMTAILYYVGFDGECKIESGPNMTMTGSCDEPIPWESTIEWNLYARCCCD